MTPSRLLSILRDRGCTRLLGKRLSPNDNSKNQIYLGGDYSAIRVIPFGGLQPDSSERAGGRTERLKAGIRLEWVGEDGGVQPAAGANLILYPKYPEVRLSGVLKGVQNRGLSEIVASRNEGRWLFLGLGSNLTVLALAVGPGSPCAEWAESCAATSAKLGVFHELPISGGLKVPDIRDELRRVAGRGWIESKRLDSAGCIRPCHAENCGGYTLEAELGIRPNGRSEPDFAGWEVKQFAVRDLGRPSGGPITLFTPEPDGGFYREGGVVGFLKRFGRPNSRGISGRLDFGGIHRVGNRHPGTRLTLELEGWDPVRKRIVDVEGGVRLVVEDGADAARWSFRSLIEHWKRKHDRAVFVPSERREEPRAYRYSHCVFAGIGADFSRVLSGFASGEVYYDPGIKLEESGGRPVTKRRSQFRIHFRNLSSLYESTQWWDLTV